jgi:hypothetical protein
MDKLALSVGDIGKTGLQAMGGRTNMRGTICDGVRGETRVQASSRGRTELSVWSVLRCANVDPARFRSSDPDLERAASDDTTRSEQNL